MMRNKACTWSRQPPGGKVRLIDQFVPFANPVDPVGIGLGA